MSSGHLLLGQRLPPERVLAERLGCSRHVLRGQLALLEQQGRITRTVGRGTYLSATAPARRQTTSSPDAVLEARIAWEPRLMHLVAIRATDGDFERFERCLAQGVAAQTVQEREEADMVFHRALAAGAHNEVVDRMHALLEESRSSLTWGRVGDEIYTQANWASCRDEHESIADALRERDAATASQRMRTHLLNVRRQFFADL
ncbi:FadR/GntR family transcriptional regulator [Kineosporia babensis]|uniref:FCD domain-containing protein n=1 Tax=Kineosporia babensis TaxID=499548 RepID=A0A9X1NMH5_9ACTN|nr:FCD domain-containing protein [Kineosporia babensis]MCD5315813.1 FCD domain-containing protein [Kineosporia babensis]